MLSYVSRRRRWWKLLKTLPVAAKICRKTAFGEEQCSSLLWLENSLETECMSTALRTVLVLCGHSWFFALPRLSSAMLASARNSSKLHVWMSSPGGLEATCKSFDEYKGSALQNPSFLCHGRFFAGKRFATSAGIRALASIAC